jgi:hypothetical protein
MTGKARLLTAVVVVSNVAGNLLLSLGLKSKMGSFCRWWRQASPFLSFGLWPE